MGDAALRCITGVASDSRACREVAVERILNPSGGVTLHRALLAFVTLVLAAALLPAGFVLESRLAAVFADRARLDLASAVGMLTDRTAASSDAMMMYAKEVAHTPALAAAVRAGDRARARGVLEQARDSYGVSGVLVVGDEVWAGVRPDSQLLIATRSGRMPVAVQAVGGTLHRLALAPVEGMPLPTAAGVLTAIDRAEAERLVGLTQSDVVLLAPGGVAATTLDPGLARRLAPLLDTLPRGAEVHELEVDAERFLVAVTGLPGEGAVAFVRPLARELRLLPRLRNLALAAALVAVAVALLGAAVFGRMLVRPVRALADAADRLAGGDFTAPLPPSRLREVSRLSEAFAAMRRALQARLDELEDRRARLVILQAQLIQRDRLAAAGRLVAQLAHEIRNPIANVRNCLELVRRGAGDDAVTYSTMAVGELQRLHDIAEHLLDLHRPRRDDGRCDAAGVARDVVALARLGAPASLDVQLATGCAPLGCAIAADALKQVLLNLCTNAREALEDAGTVTVVVGQEGSLVRVEVLDDGPGIAREALPRVLDPFFTTKSSVHGVGLGLFVAEGIVRSAGGELTAANRSDGRGACFTIRLAAARLDGAVTPTIAVAP